VCCGNDVYQARVVKGQKLRHKMKSQSKKTPKRKYVRKVKERCSSPLPSPASTQEDQSNQIDLPTGKHDKVGPVEDNDMSSEEGEGFHKLKCILFAH
jgi:hypothetical protein